MLKKSQYPPLKKRKYSAIQMLDSKVMLVDQIWRMDKKETKKYQKYKKSQNFFKSKKIRFLGFLLICLLLYGLFRLGLMLKQLNPQLRIQEFSIPIVSWYGLMVGIPLLLVLRFLFLHSFKFRYTHYGLWWRPWACEWQTSISVHLQGTEMTPDHLLSFLHNHPRHAIRLHTYIGPLGANIYLILMKKRRFLPPTPSGLRKQLFGLLLSLGIKGEFCHLPAPQGRYRYFGIQSDTSIPPIQLIAERLESYPNKDFLLQLQVQSQDAQLKGSLQLGISYKQQVPIIQAFIGSLGHGIRLKKPKSQEMGPEWLILPQIILQPERIVKQPLGQLLVHGEPHSPFGLEPDDLAQGGIICGAIGTGKTTLRLQLLQQLLQKDIRVIDFDLKGDAPRYLSLGSQGLIVQPGNNFFINPFLCPKGYSSQEYSDTLIRIFLDTIPHHETLTPPQKHLLIKATQKTVEQGGTARDFFHNLLVLGSSEQEVLDNYQEHTSQALLVKFSWMQHTLGNIFWREGSSLGEEEYSKYNLYFDFSVLMHLVPHTLIRFLMDVIMTRIMGSIRLQNPQYAQQLVIFIDEAQILMPRRKAGDQSNLSRLEETVATLRYKGVSVVATGISADLMSRVLLDTGLIVQFRSESLDLLRGLGLLEPEDRALVPHLEPYTCVLRRGSSTVQLAVHPFSQQQLDPDEYQLVLKSQHLPYHKRLLSFSLNFTSLWRARFDGILQQSRQFVDVDHLPIDYEHAIRFLATDKMEELASYLFKQFQSKYAQLSQQAHAYPKEFILAILVELLVEYA
jgi:hypothetical protein